MKRVRAKSGRLPIRYRCKDKYNRALEAQMQKFIASDTSEEDAASQNAHPVESNSSSRSCQDANIIGIPISCLYSVNVSS